MSTPNTVMNQLNSLLSLSNRTTGVTNTNITDAVNSLVNGYGGGGTQSISGSITVTNNSTDSIVHNSGYEKYICIVIGRNLDPSTFTSTRCIDAVAVRNADLFADGDNDSIFYFTRTSQTGSISWAGGRSASTPNKCQVCLNTMQNGGVYDWICVKM